MLARSNIVTRTASQISEEDRLYDHLSGLAALSAFPSSKLPLDLAVTLAAAADSAKERIAAILPRYCGFGIGDVVEVAAIASGANTARVEGVCINEGGTASIQLQPLAADGAAYAVVQFPLFYARTGLSRQPSSCA